MKKNLIRIAVVLLVLLGVAGYYALKSAGRIVKYGIERYGPPILGVPVTVKNVFILPLVGSGSVKGVVIGNPKGYQDPHLLELDTASISINLRSLLSDVIRVDEVTIKNPLIFWEGTITNDSNISRIQENVAKSLGTTPAKNPRKFWIGKFAIRGAKVKANVKGVGPLDITLNDIEMKDIRSDQKDKAIQQVVAIVLNEISRKIIYEIAHNPQVLKQAGHTVEGVVNGIKSLFGK